MANAICTRGGLSGTGGVLHFGVRLCTHDHTADMGGGGGVPGLVPCAWPACAAALPGAAASGAGIGGPGFKGPAGIHPNQHGIRASVLIFSSMLHICICVSAAKKPAPCHYNTYRMVFNGIGNICLQNTHLISTISRWEKGTSLEGLLQASLTHIPAVQVCQRYGMRAAERGICITVGMERLQQGHLAAALQWLGRAGDERALEAAARTLVQSIAEHAASPASTSGGLLCLHGCDNGPLLSE